MSPLAAFLVRALAGGVLFTATGAAVAGLLDLPRRSLPIHLGWSYLLGVAYLGSALYAASHVFSIPLGRTAVLSFAALPVAAALARRRLVAAPGPSGRRTWRAGDRTLVVAAASVGLVASLAVLAEAASSPPTDWDGRMTWCAQARFIQGARTVDAPALREARWWVTHPRYPVLLPVAQVAVLEVVGAADDRFVRPLYALFLPALLLVVYDFASRRTGRGVAAFWTLVAALTPFLAWRSGGAGGCYSDLPLGCFFGGGLAVLGLDPRRLSTGLTGGLLLGAAVLTKNEGLPFVVLALGAVALANPRRLRLRPWRDPRLVGALGLVAAATLLLVSWRSAIPNRYDDFFFERASPGALASGLERNARSALGCVAALTISRASWGFLWLALPVLAALGGRALLRRRTLPLWLAPSGAALVILAAYLLVPGDVVKFVVGSWNRLLVEIAIPALLVGAVATRQLLGRRRTAARGAGA